MREKSKSIENNHLNGRISESKLDGDCNSPFYACGICRHPNINRVFWLCPGSIGIPIMAKIQVCE